MCRVTKEKLEIGRRIKALRLAHKLDQGTLGMRCGVSRAAISAYEHGLNGPTMECAKALAKALDVELKEIIPRDIWKALCADRLEKQSKALKRANDCRCEAARKRRLEKEERGESQSHPDSENQPAWMEEARQAAKERAKRDEQRATATRTRRKRREPEPEPGATSGFISDAELASIPQFLHEVIIDQHIRRMLFLCGEYGRRENVKKTRTPLGVAWSAEETA